MPQRHIPQRTCVACRSERPKREMVRIVRAPDGAVSIDPTGKRSGRGAYLCLRASCWHTALKRHALDRALKTELSEADRAALTAFGASEATLVAADDRQERGA
ncbi:MAG: YlxR family protein [Chloroflexi bacterium]|nr:YlxR family protein [Chloroflexota bacterium]